MMTETLQSRPIHIGFSSLNVSPREAVATGADSYLAMQSEGGYDEQGSILWSDVRLLPGIRKAGQELAKHGLIGCVEESWREDTVGDVIGHLTSDGKLKDRIVSAASIAAIMACFTPLDKGYNTLDAVQEAAGKKLPILVNPEFDSTYDVPRRPRQSYPAGMFAKVLYQPTAFWAAAHNIALHSHDHTGVAEQVVEAQTLQGLDGIELNLNALYMTKGDKKFRYPQEVAVALARQPSLHAITVALRPDFGGDTETMRKACAGKLAETAMGEALAAIHEALPRNQALLLRVKAKPGEVKATRPDANYRDSHRQITEGIRDIFKTTA